jgi:hypothetical protein
VHSQSYLPRNSHKSGIVLAFDHKPIYNKAMDNKLSFFRFKDALARRWT